MSFLGSALPLYTAMFVSLLVSKLVWITKKSTQPQLSRARLPQGIVQCIINKCTFVHKALYRVAVIFPKWLIIGSLFFKNGYYFLMVDVDGQNIIIICVPQDTMFGFLSLGYLDKFIRALNSTL